MMTLGGAVACGDDVDEPTTEAATPTSDGPAPSTTSAPAPPTTADPTAACIAALPVRQRVAQLVGIAIDGGALPGEAQRAADLGVGVVLVQRPGGDLAEGIAAVKQASAVPPLVAVDEEGGDVQHLRSLLGSIPSERDVAATLDGAAAAALVRPHFQAVADLGFDVVFAPVVDVAAPGGGGPLGDRTFSDDPATVTAYGQVYVDAMQDAGLLPVLKHFPGHGSGEANSHDGPVGTPPIEALRARDLLPFEALVSDPPVGVMVGHLNVPGLSGTTPASISPAAYALLRDELAFEGLVFSDSLSMGAIAGTIPPESAAVQSVAAGADVALFVTIADPAAAITALEQAVADGSLPPSRVDESVGRVLAAKGIDPCTL
ncbi:MAG: glycoside hydrolase family 3 protein [Microthrixaceae bacterium]|nr:glycoside hydrolase family 3 protein [Microthrixaceae bacterium]